MNQNYLRTLICFLLGTAVVSSAESTAFDSANQVMRAGKFAGAAAAYENILSIEGTSAAVLYNLGSAYYRLGQHGPAILAYERARLLTPRDPDLLSNLAITRKAAGAVEEAKFDPRLDAALNYLSRDEWSWLVVNSAMIIGTLAFLFGALDLPQRRLRQMALTATCLAGLVIVIGSVALYLRRDEANRGVVLSQNAAVRLSPFDHADPLGYLAPGHFVQLGQKSGNFFHIEVPASSLRGWLSSKDVAALVASDHR